MRTYTAPPKRILAGTYLCGSQRRMMTKLPEVEAVLAESLHLLDRQRKKRAQVREQSKKVYGELLRAHWLALSVIANATSAVSSKPGKSDTSLAQMLSLSASFIQGIDICEFAISEGLYFSASALLKQEMETIAAIREVRSKVRKSGITPNVRSFGEFAVLYGDLNKLAHVGEPDLLQEVVSISLSEGQAGAPLFPVFNPKLAKVLYGTHTSLVVMLAVEVGLILEDLYGKEFGDVEVKLLVKAGDLLAQEGWVRRQPATQQEV